MSMQLPYSVFQKNASLVFLNGERRILGYCMIAGMLVLEKSHHAKLSREILVSTSHIYIKHSRCCCNLEMFEGETLPHRKHGA